MNIVTVIVMIVAFIGLIISAKIQKTNPSAKLLAIFCLVVVLAGAVKFMADTGAFGGDTSEVRQQKASYARFTEATCKTLAEALNAAHPSDKIAIVTGGGADFEKQLTPESPANLIKKYLANKDNATIMGLPIPPRTNENEPMDDQNRAEYYNKLFDQNSSIKVFVFALDLPFEPSELAKLKVWGKKNGPKVAVLNLSDFKMFYNEFRNGVVSAAVMMRPDLQQKDFDTLAPENLDEAFKARYVLVTPKTVDEVAKKYFAK